MLRIKSNDDLNPITNKNALNFERLKNNTKPECASSKVAVQSSIVVSQKKTRIDDSRREYNLSKFASATERNNKGNGAYHQIHHRVEIPGNVLLSISNIFMVYTLHLTLQKQF